LPTLNASTAPLALRYNLEVNIPRNFFLNLTTEITEFLQLFSLREVKPMEEFNLFVIFDASDATGKGGGFIFHNGHVTKGKRFEIPSEFRINSTMSELWILNSIISFYTPYLNSFSRKTTSMAIINDNQAVATFLTLGRCHKIYIVPFLREVLLTLNALKIPHDMFWQRRSSLALQAADGFSRPTPSITFSSKFWKILKTLIKKLKLPHTDPAPFFAEIFSEHSLIQIDWFLLKKIKVHPHRVYVCFPGFSKPQIEHALFLAKLLQIKIVLLIPTCSHKILHKIPAKRLAEFKKKHLLKFTSRKFLPISAYFLRFDKNNFDNG
jgi:hypothetical protein